MLSLAAFRPAFLIFLAQPYQPGVAAACQSGDINALILAGMDLSPDVWELVLHQPAPKARALLLLFPCADWTFCAKAHKGIEFSNPWPMCFASPGYLFLAGATKSLWIDASVALVVPLFQ